MRTGEIAATSHPTRGLRTLEAAFAGVNMLKIARRIVEIDTEELPHARANLAYARETLAQRKRDLADFRSEYGFLKP